MIKDKKYIESDIRASDSVEDLKQILLNLLETIPEDNFPSYREHELLAERVGNIETCLDNSKINTDNLRL